MATKLAEGLDQALADVRNRTLEEVAVLLEATSAAHLAAFVRGRKSEHYAAGRWVGIGGRGKRKADELEAAQEQADEAHQARVEAIRMEEREGLILDPGGE